MNRKNRLRAFAQYSVQTKDFDLQKRLILTAYRIPKRFFKNKLQA